jgi:hypothetical protein
MTSSIITPTSTPTSQLQNQQQQQPLAPLLKTNIIPLINNEYHIQWSFNSTLACRLFGRQRSLTIWKWIIGGKYGVGKLIFWIIFVTAWICLTILEVFKIGGYNSYVTQFFLLFSCGVFFIIFTTAMYFFDLRITKIIIKSGFFLSNMAVAIVALIATCDVWGYDERGLITGMLLCIVAFISCIDSFPPELRRVVGVPIFLILVFAFFSVLIVLAFGRFPNSQERIIDLGDLSGLATSNITMSVSQLAGDSTSAFVVLSVRMLYHVWEFRNSGYLIRLQAPLRCYEDPEYPLQILTFLEFLRPKQILKPSLKFIPVLEPSVERLLDRSTGRVKWSLKNTILSKCIGVENAQQLIHFMLAGEYKIQLIKSFIFLMILLTFVILAIITFFGLVPITPLIGLTIFMIFLDVYMLVAFFDSHILVHIFKTFDFWLQMSLGLLGAIAMCLYWGPGLDIRDLLAVPFLFLVFFVSSIDALLPRIRETAGPFILLAILLFYVLLILLVQLGRFPNQTPLIYQWGTFGGLSARPLNTSIQQTLTNVLVGQVGMFFFLLVDFYDGRHDMKLSTIGLRVVGAGDPTFVHFPALGEVKFMGLGTLLEQSRRVSVVDSNLIVTSSNVADNPNFDGDTNIDKNENNNNERKVNF